MKMRKFGLSGMMAAVALAVGGAGNGSSLSERVAIYRKEAATRRQMRIRNTGTGALKSARTEDQVDLLKFEALVKRSTRRAKLRDTAKRRDENYYAAIAYPSLRFSQPK